MQLITRINEEEVLRALFVTIFDQCETGRYEVVLEDHEDFEYTLRRDEDGTEHQVTLPMAIEGFQKFVLAIHACELDEICELDTDIIGDPEAWDCDDIDLLLQFIIDGKVVEP